MIPAVSANVSVGSPGKKKRRPAPAKRAEPKEPLAQAALAATPVRE